MNALKSYWDPGSYCGAVEASTYPRYPVYEDEKGYIKLVERMLKQGAGANVASQNGRVFMTSFEKDTPLQLIKMLVEHGAFISHQSKVPLNKSLQWSPLNMLEQQLTTVYIRMLGTLN